MLDMKKGLIFYTFTVIIPFIIFRIAIFTEVRSFIFLLKVLITSMLKW